MNDFQKLYDALSELVGEEGEYKGFENPRIRVLAICYDLRHAIMGDREFELVDNGMEEFNLRRAGFIAMDKQTRLKNIPLMAKRLVEQNDEYRSIKRTVMQAAEENGRHHGDFELRGVEYPEDILW